MSHDVALDGAEQLLGLSKLVPCISMCSSSSSSAGTVGFFLSLTEQPYLKQYLIFVAFAKCLLIMSSSRGCSVDISGPCYWQDLQIEDAPHCNKHLHLGLASGCWL